MLNTSNHVKTLQEGLIVTPKDQIRLFLLALVLLPITLPLSVTLLGNGPHDATIPTLVVTLVVVGAASIKMRKKR
jgi:hypothetical protein